MSAGGHTKRNITAPLLAALAFVAALSAIAQAQYWAESPHAIEIHSAPLDAFDNRDPTRKQFGVLEFRGGIQLTSSDKHFGGISAIRIGADGARFIALSDKGRWFRGRIVYRENKPVGIADAESAPMLGPDGRPLAERGWFDTESLAEDGDALYVGIERVNEIVRFDYGKDGLLARGQPIKVPPEVKKLPYNKGLEAMVMIPRGMPLAGTLVAISERGVDENGNVRAFLIGGPRPGNFSVKQRDDFDVSDAAILPDGDLLLLERHFSIARGVIMRIRRIAQASLKPGALVDGNILMEADLGFQIDNMEGLSVHRTGDGETVLTLVSDDNFSAIQRTILLQFTLQVP